MSNSNAITSNHSHTINSTVTSTGVFPCPKCGTYNCFCSSFAPIIHPSNLSFCGQCLQSYNPAFGHYCSAIQTSPNITWPPYTTGTSTWTTNFNPIIFKEVKEIITDSELIYEWSGSSFNIKLPTKFSDCFLKIGYTWSPLYPLIFSAFENDSKELSFHLVVGIMDKVFEGDQVILKSVTTVKIEDNLTFVQLCERTKEFFKEDKK